MWEAFGAPMRAAAQTAFIAGLAWLILDPPSLEAIGTALSGWKGAMVIVSHDARFVERLAPQRVLLMPEATLNHWDDGMLDLVEMA